MTALRSVVYEAPGWGLGELVFRGDVPVHHEMPHDDSAPTGEPAASPAERALVDRLVAYFAGDRSSFADVDLGPTLEWAGVTPFEERCLRELQRIPYGETISYGELAKRVDRPEAARAVGSANGQNPIAIVVPCHRVIGADGSLTGFGGGLDWKRWLLAREQPQGSLLDA